MYIRIVQVGYDSLTTGPDNSWTSILTMLMTAFVLWGLRAGYNAIKLPLYVILDIDTGAAWFNRPTYFGTEVR